jgi:hypothetical protein
VLKRTRKRILVTCFVQLKAHSIKEHSNDYLVIAVVLYGKLVLLRHALDWGSVVDQTLHIVADSTIEQKIEHRHYKTDVETLSAKGRKCFTAKRNKYKLSDIKCRCCACSSFSTHTHTPPPAAKAKAMKQCQAFYTEN